MSELSNAVGGLNMTAAIQGYVSKVIAIPGMKSLVLDEETTGIVSLVYAQSQIIAKEVFLVERLDQQGGAKAEAAQQPMHHLKAIVFVRPTRATVDAIIAQLKKPKYKEYHLFFSNVLPKEFLRALAEADEFEVIKQVQEYYGDVYSVNPDVYHVNTPLTFGLLQPEAFWHDQDRLTFQRQVHGIMSALLAMKKRPIVRYSRSSALAQKTAMEVVRRMKEEAELFHFGQSSGNPLLLVLDRRDDPVTPLLSQWTYQAMVHELIGIKNNRVNMSKVPGIRKELRDIVLSCDQDHFFRGSMFLNFGDLGASIKDLVEDYQRKVKSNTKIQTLEDMTRFVENYPEFRSLSGNVSKHVAIMSELSRLVDQRQLMAVSELEQDLACQHNHSDALERCLRLLNDPRVAFQDKLRVVLLYALRYEKSKNELPQLKALLRDRASTPSERLRCRAVDKILQHAGTAVRGGDLFGNKSFWGRTKNIFGGGLKGVENIYTQHKPLLAATLDKVLADKLKPAEYPFVDRNQSAGKHSDVFVYILGGVTFEEALAVHTINKSDSGTNVLLGGSFIHNSSSFLDDVLGGAKASAFGDDDERKVDIM
eukprot:TRINITY_DN54857_c0_g1_i1.p1 TRINITY_DN54857_c0_g1~~TRINITY_DN54857_c0_g1_i1.p1  ORF type:complete len:601 (+),score=364.71 TRINITY_DN54857_c0_g1_i1:29-1804(+)